MDLLGSTASIPFEMDPRPRLVRFGEFTLDTSSGELLRGGRRVVLPDQPFHLLAILIREQGRLVSRDALRHELWSDDTFVDFEAGLNAAVKRLREVLGDSAASPTFIETIPRRGYRFIAPVEAVQPTRSRRISRTVVPMVAVAGVALVAIALVAGTSRTKGGSSRRLGPEPKMARLTNLGTVAHASLSPDGRNLAYVRSDGTRQSLWLRRDEAAEAVRLVGPIDGAFVSLTFGPKGAVYYTVFSADKTHIGLYRVSLDGGSPEAVLDASGPIAFSPDGSRHARVYNLSLALRESRVVVTDGASGSPRILTVRRMPESFVMLRPAWSPNGARLALFGASDAKPGRHEIVSVDADTGATERLAEVKLAQVEGAAWLPDGTGLIVSGREGRASPQRLWFVSIAAGEMQPLTSDVSDYSLVGVAAGGSRVLAVRVEGTRSLWVAETAAPGRAIRLAQDAGSIHGYNEVALAPDGRVLYTLGESGNADLWSIDPATRQRHRLTTDPADDFHPAVSPDGRTIVFGSNRSGGAGLWSMSRDGANLTRLTTGGDTRPSFSPDGKWVAFQRSGVETTPWMVCRVWLETRVVEQVSPPPTMRPSVSPDGRFVAHYWMTPERWLLAVTPAGGGIASAIFPVAPTHHERTLRWAPDGRALAFIDGAGGAANLWLQPLDRQPTRPLTHFDDGTIATFDWARDGSKLAWMRVHNVSDVVAIELGADKS